MTWRTLPAPGREFTTTFSWAELAEVLTLGYLVFGRSFAYLALPGTVFYVGELSLAAFLILGPWTLRTIQSPRLVSLLILSLLYGLFEGARGILSGYPGLTVVRDVAFNYYPLFIFLGVVASRTDPVRLSRIVKHLAWLNACYGIAFLLILDRVQLTMFGTSDALSPVPLFSRPAGSAIAIFALLAFEPNLFSVWHLIALNTFVMLGGMLRGEWIGFAAGVSTWLWFARRSGRRTLALIPALGLLGMMYAADVNIPAPIERGGGRISANHVVARIVAPVSEDLAASIDNYDDAAGAAATAAWRLSLWHAVWNAVHQDFGTALIGFAYGYPIGDLNWGLVRFGDFLQTPHNDLLYALAYSGWIGLLLFAAFQLKLGQLLLGCYKSSGQPFGIVIWVAVVSSSLVGSYFESPYGAIPFYIMAGLVIGQKRAVVHHYQALSS